MGKLLGVHDSVSDNPELRRRVDVLKRMFSSPALSEMGYDMKKYLIKNNHAEHSMSVWKQAVDEFLDEGDYSERLRIIKKIKENSDALRIGYITKEERKALEAELEARKANLEEMELIWKKWNK